jgi:hypothetical protein
MLQWQIAGVYFLTPNKKGIFTQINLYLIGVKLEVKNIGKG